MNPFIKTQQRGTDLKSGVTDSSKLLAALRAARVDFLVVGGVAATIHGSRRRAADLDVLYSREPANLRRMAKALSAHEPYPRGAPKGLPFRWDERTVAAGWNFTLSTRLGDLDLFAEVTGGGRYEDLLPETDEVVVLGHSVRVLRFDALIETMRALGRPRDVEAAAELEALHAEHRGADR